MKKVKTDMINYDQMEQGKISSSSKIKQVLCPEGYKAAFICFSKNCNFPAFSCSQKKCHCEKNHVNCSIKKCQSVISKIQQKLICFQPVIEENNNLITQKITYFQHLIQQMKRQKNLLYINLVQTYLKCSMSVEETTIYEKLVKKTTDSINGKFMYKAQRQIFKDMKLVIEEQISKVKNYWKNSIFITPFMLINKIKTFRQNKQTSINFYNFNKISKIVKLDQDLQFLQKLFVKKNIFNANLLYRASQNQYRISRFKQSCSNIAYTLVLIKCRYKSLYQKIVGGFTNLPWNNLGVQVYDGKFQETCVFSLSDKQRLRGYTMKNYINYGPVFVDNSNKIYNLQIVRKSNETQTKCLIKLPLSKIPLFQGYKFTAVQWQVWQLIFNNKIGNKV